MRRSVLPDTGEIKTLNAAKEVEETARVDVELLDTQERRPNLKKVIGLLLLSVLLVPTASFAQRANPRNQTICDQAGGILVAQSGPNGEDVCHLNACTGGGGQAWCQDGTTVEGSPATDILQTGANTPGGGGQGQGRGGGRGRDKNKTKPPKTCKVPGETTSTTTHNKVGEAIVAAASSALAFGATKMAEDAVVAQQGGEYFLSGEAAAAAERAAQEVWGDEYIAEAVREAKLAGMRARFATQQAVRGVQAAGPSIVNAGRQVVQTVQTTARNNPQATQTVVAAGSSITASAAGSALLYATAVAVVGWTLYEVVTMTSIIVGIWNDGVQTEQAPDVEVLCPEDQK